MPNRNNTVVDQSPRGVYAANANRPPRAPASAEAIEIVDAKGEVIAFAWVVRRHAVHLDAQAYDWLDMVDPVSDRAASRPTLRLVTSAEWTPP